MVETSTRWRGILGRLAAEFAIIVLGVTIALWADGWVARRSDQAKEIARLHALQDNVGDTLAELRDARHDALGAADAFRELVSLHEQGWSDDEVEELLRYGLLFGAAFFPELNVYDDLKSSGELALLTNAELRRSLAGMDARLEAVRVAQADLATVQQLNVDAYMIDHLDLRSFYGSLTGLDDTSDDSELNLEFTSDTKFQNLVLLKLDVVTQLEIAFQNAEKTLMVIQQMIASQLENQPR